MVLLAGCGLAPSGSIDGDASSLRPSPRTGSFSAAEVQRTIDDLASLGIETRVRPSDGAPITPAQGDRSAVRLLRLQVRNLALELAAGGGTRGADLDRLSAAAGGGPVSALVAGWAASGPTPAARWTTALLAQPAPADPATSVLPTLALVAFVADVSAGSQTSARPAGATTAMLHGHPGAGLRERATLSVAQGSDFCADVSAYLAAALDDIVEANADPPPWMKQLIDLYAPQYANDPGLLRRTIGAIALLSYATSLARSWNVNLAPDPSSVAYGIAGAEPVTGAVVLSVWAGEDVFSDDVADCASLAEAELASTPIEGSTVMWDASGLGTHANEATAVATLDANGTAELDYETATESQEIAENGDPTTAQMWVSAWVDRAEMAALAAVVKAILLGDAAGTPAGSTAKALYEAMEPTLNLVMRPSGFALIDVTYHTTNASPGPSATPTAAASSTGDVEHATDCASLLPQTDVMQAVGVDIGTPTELGEYSALQVACVWEDVAWELQGQAKTKPFPPTDGQLAGITCARSGHLRTTLYCLNGDKGVVGGFVLTSRWGLILGTAMLSIDQVVDEIIPILDRTAN